MEKTINAYNTLVGALDSAIQKGTFDLAEVRQIVASIEALGEYITEEQRKARFELGADSVGA